MADGRTYRYCDIFIFRTNTIFFPALAEGKKIVGNK